ncbi:CBS domain-containing protein [Aridibaculum aurantiacum]|uniref:CBS domain-containing protein n=1 Tax=Aridibaculum aurantiacum TaxID=2810307 RepID=UPI001A97A07F|nr:CBS domain-containing protein [Aridibaculum aurantiacum]
MRTVQNILDIKDKEDNVIEPSTMVIDALRKLIDVNLSYLVVMENGEFKGLFSERDYTRKLVLQDRSSRNTAVQDVMTVDLPEVTPDNTVEECMYQMNIRGARYLAVYNEADFLGIITIHDLLRQVLANKHQVFDDTLTTSLLNNDASSKIL